MNGRRLLQSAIAFNPQRLTTLMAAPAYTQVMTTAPRT
jgi:hypothetical protein